MVRVAALEPDAGRRPSTPARRRPPRSPRAVMPGDREREATISSVIARMRRGSRMRDGLAPERASDDAGARRRRAGEELGRRAVDDVGRGLAARARARCAVLGARARRWRGGRGPARGDARTGPGPARPVRDRCVDSRALWPRNRDRHRRRGGQGPGPRHPRPVRRARGRARRARSRSSRPRRRWASRPASATGPVFTELGASEVRPLHAMTRAQANDEHVAPPGPRRDRRVPDRRQPAAAVVDHRRDPPRGRHHRPVPARARSSPARPPARPRCSSHMIAFGASGRDARSTGWRRSPRASACCRASSSTSTSSSGTGSAGCSRSSPRTRRCSGWAWTRTRPASSGPDA